MDRTILGRTGIEVTRLGAGLFQIGTLEVEQGGRLLTRIHRFIQVDGVRTAEGCEGVTGAIIRA